MTDLLLKLFGIKATGSSRIADTDVSFHGVNPAWVILAALVLGAVVFLMYRRAGEGLSLFRRISLFILRAAFLLLILGLLLRPVLTVAFEHAVRRTILLLFDTSASMSEIKDRRTDEEDVKRVALVTGRLDPTKGLAQPLPTGSTGQSEISRIDIAKAAFKDNRLALLKKLSADFDIAAFAFDRKAAEISEAAYRATIEESQEGDAAESTAPQEQPRLNTGWIDKLAAAGPVSAVGDAVGDVIAAKRGQLLAGVVLVTDGASNAGMLPIDAANRAGQERVPLFVYGVGITSPRDIVVSHVLAPEVAFVKDDVPVQVLVKATGLAGQTAPLVLVLGDQKVEHLVTFNADGEQILTVNITPQQKGEFAIAAAIAPREDEVVKDNNVATQAIKVVDDKIKVLYVEQYPRWEFKYLQAALMRDRRVAARFWLLEGDDSIARSQDSPYLAEFPTAKEELFKYDLVILGDVDPRALTSVQWETLSEFVSRFGGAIVTIAGKRYMPSAYRRSPLEKMLPVELDSTDIGVQPIANKPIKLELTPLGRTTPMLRLTEGQADPGLQWGLMPPIYWVQKVARAKPSAEVLVVDPDTAKASRQGKMPVVALHQYDLGQVLYVGTDNLWRWRRNAGDKFHATLWGQMVQRLALPHLLGASKRTRIRTDAKSYSTGQTAKVYARLYTEGFQPLTESAVRASFTRSDQPGASEGFILRPVPGHPGMYQGEVAPRLPGRYAITVDHDKDPQTAEEFTVAEQKVELAESAMNKALLEQMAKASGGAFFREEDLHTLPAKLTGQQERVRSKLDVELWSSPFYFLAMLIVVTAEWILRKVSQLK